MDTLAALCDILGCTPNDLIKVEVANAQVRKTAEGTPTPPPPVRRSTIRHPDST
ncbi:helix-turn-helix domain-containing protein [Streptomyces althioticus]